MPLPEYTISLRTGQASEVEGKGGGGGGQKGRAEVRAGGKEEGRQGWAKQQHHPSCRDVVTCGSSMVHTNVGSYPIGLE